MTSIMLAADPAATPVSVLRQKAKQIARTEDIQLAQALDRVANDHATSNWDAMMSEAWRFDGATENGTQFEMSRKLASGKLQLNAMIEEGVGPAVYARLARKAKSDGVEDHFFLSPYKQFGRRIQVGEDQLKSLSPGAPMQQRMQALLSIYRSHHDNLPVMLGCADLNMSIRLEMEPRLEPEDLPAPVDHLVVVVEVPDSRERLVARVPLAESATAFLARVKPEHTARLEGFKVQKDGSLVLRRKRVTNPAHARTSLRNAVRMIALLSWAGLNYPWGREKDIAHRDSFRIGGNKLYDHYHILTDHVTGGTVTLNQPYSGDAGINEHGLLNLVGEKVMTAFAPRFTSLHGGTLVMFHALGDSGVDLQRISVGAERAALVVKQVTVETVTPGKNERVSPTPETEGGKAGKPADRVKFFADYIKEIEYDWEAIPTGEKVLLHYHLPQRDALSKPYYKTKMKPFEGKELLSWALQDKYETIGISHEDVTAAIKKCPLDADLWGFFHLFNFSDEMKIELYCRGIVAGEAYIGRKAMKDEEGDFWSVLKTRPYMRCLNLLYRHLVKMERPADAAPIGRRMLELCANDNIGIGFSIEGIEAAVNDPDLAKEWAETFKDEEAANRA